VVVFGSSCGETAEKAIKQITNQRPKKQIAAKKFCSPHFFCKNLFLCPFSKKKLWCFWNPLADKRTKTPQTENRPKKSPYLPALFSGYLPDIRRFHFCFFGALRSTADN
jgi:hypothetical protein